MKKFATPKIGISKCLEHDSCRYNGLMISSEVVSMLKRFVDFYPVCPEVEIGLGIPRAPINIVLKNGKKTLFQPSTGIDVTQKMTDFVNEYSKNLKNLDCFIFKTSSPSCGPKGVKLYNESGNKLHEKTSGTFAGPIIDFLKKKPFEDEGRLRNYKLRELFLTKIFMLADFRENVENNKPSSLVKFHSENKYMLMTFSQKYLKILGKIVSEAGKGDFSEKIQNYKENLYNAVDTTPKTGNHINVLQHIYGYFKDTLIPAEKNYFDSILWHYKNNKLPLSVPVGILRMWLARYPNEYLASQTYLNPYPEELVVISDSEQGRDLS